MPCSRAIGAGTGHIIVLNFVIFWLLYVLLPGRLIVEDPVLLRLMVAGTLVALSATVLEAILGATTPSPSSQRSHLAL